ATDRADILISWLIEERMEPSGTTLGLGGGDINSGYIMSQIIMSLVELGDPLLVLEVATSSHLASVDDNVRDAMRITLGLMGDGDQARELMRILDTHAEPYFRALAAKALGRVGAAEARPRLKRALEDPFTVRAGNSVRGLYTAYPVREGAETALRMLDDPARFTHAKQRAEMFAQRLDNARKQAIARGMSPPASGIREDMSRVAAAQESTADRPGGNEPGASVRVSPSSTSGSSATQVAGATKLREGSREVASAPSEAARPERTAECRVLLASGGIATLIAVAALLVFWLRTMRGTGRKRDASADSAAL
ncbi:MAG: HEAT repeat domain-containing protein, partial [Armatimonadota bacterium]